jgi:hypothetical protein
MLVMGQVESAGANGATFSYGEMTGLAAALSSSASPWYTVGMAWPDSDYQAFGKQLCSWESTYNFPAMLNVTTKTGMAVKAVISR